MGIVNQEVQLISKEEVGTAMKRIKNGKAVGPDAMPVKAYRGLGQMAVADFLMQSWKVR